MSDERIDVTLREAVEPTGATSDSGWGSVIARLWKYLKDHFPLLTGRAGAYADAKVDQERAAAAVKWAEADLISAKAEEIRSGTELRLAILTTLNELQRAERDLSDPAGRVDAAEAELKGALDRLSAMGIKVEISPVAGARQALPAPAAEPDSDVTPGSNR